PPGRGRGNFGWGSPRLATLPPGWGNFGRRTAAGGAGGGAGRRHAPPARAGRAGDPAAQPPRLRHLRSVPRLRERVALPPVQRRADVPSHAPAARLPLLLPRGTATDHLRPLRLGRPLVPRHRPAVWQAPDHGSV